MDLGQIALIDGIGSNDDDFTDLGFRSAQTISHPMVNITSDDDFIDQGWPGTGTSDDPFIIQRLNIRSDNWCIRVTDTAAYFKIVDCEFSSADRLHQQGIGVILRNVTHALIEACQMRFLGIAVYDVNGEENIYRENTVDRCGDGFLIDFAHNITIIDNIQTKTEQNSGVTLYYSAECAVIRNQLESVYLMGSTECSVLDNELHGRGFRFYCMKSSDWAHHIENNSINGKLFGYFREISGLAIDGDQFTQIVIVGCNDLTVSRGVFQNVFDGILVFNSNRVVLQDMTVRDNSKRGVVIQESSDCEIINGNFENNQFGGVLVTRSSGITVERSLVNYSNTGIELRDSAYCNVIRNTIHDQWDGLLLMNTSDCQITENNVNDNYRGLRLESTNRCDIIGNVITYNEIGLIISRGSFNNSIYWNSFFSNSKNARDDGGSNTWDDSIRRGNGWDNYSGFGVYEIPGIAESIDRFPYRSVYILPIPLFQISLLALIVVLIIVVKKRRHWIVREVSSSIKQE